MVGLQMRVNNKNIIVNVQAIRKTKSKTPPKDGDLCKYEIRVYNTKVSEIHCEYGSAVKLGHMMLDEYEKVPQDKLEMLHILEIEREVKKREEES